MHKSWKAENNVNSPVQISCDIQLRGSGHELEIGSRQKATERQTCAYSPSNLQCCPSFSAPFKKRKRAEKVVKSMPKVREKFLYI